MDTIRRLLGRRGVPVEVIVVDDRSTDRTSEILGGLAAEGPRVRVRRVDTLSDGWLGRCHACHLGEATSTGEWLLFTDADCCLLLDKRRMHQNALLAKSEDTEGPGE